MAFNLPKEDRDLLLALARATIAAHLDNRPPSLPEHSAALDENRGAFVTLHKNRALRGCIGRMVADTPLVSLISKMAIAAAFEDPRFPPLDRTELETVELEISVLSPMETCKPDEVIPGTHGVFISRGFRSGVFLPQVAVEQGWNRETFLEHLCYKAGLPGKAYLEHDSRLMRFTALVFSEHER